MRQPDSRSPLRIALLAHSNSPWAPYYARYLSDRGFNLKLISFHPKQIPGIDVECVGQENEDGCVPKSLYLRRVPRVRRILRAWNPDVVFATYIRSNGLVGALTKCSALVVSSRGADHDWGLPGSLDLRLTRWIGERSELLHASSAELAESLIARGISSDKITVVPLGIDPNEFVPRPGPRHPGAVRILCTRKHFPIYDNDTIVRALALLRDQEFSFEARFAGIGPTLIATRRLAQTLALEDRVSFVGERTSREVVQLLHWADIYLSAAHSDGAPSSLFEAMSCGVFPVVTDVRANRDWIQHRYNGYLCATGRELEWARGVRFAWETPGIREASLQVNRALVLQHCDRRVGLEKTERILLRAFEMYREKHSP